MSRAPIADNSTTVSLFPFLAVLLCTMGALLVVLVAMTRSARDVAQRNVEATPAAVIAPVDPQAEERLKQVQQYQLRLDQIRSEAARRLREDQQRLTVLEEHMRHLQDQLKKLQLAAAELQALKNEHYDDRAQAEREVARLQQLIADTREAIADIMAEQETHKRSYALVPYEGAGGTLQRPMFIECRDGEILLQPEGIQITRDDLRPPLGAGNALASALRAARGYLVHLHPDEGQTRATEPYALIVVRPSGVAMFGLTQRALQASDLDFGYELVEEDWDLKYAAPDPQLAVIEQQAIEQARIRQMALAAAAPRAYRQPAMASVGQFGFDEEEEAGFGSSGSGDDANDGEADGIPGGDGEPGSGSGMNGIAPLAGEAGGSEANGTESGAYGANSTSAAASNNGPTGTANEPGSAAANSSQPAEPGTSTSAATSAGASSLEPTEMPPGGPDSIGPTASRAGGQAAGRVGNSTKASAQNRHAVNSHAPLAVSRGEDWALRRKNTQEVPIRRTIRVEVRGNELAVLPDTSQTIGKAPGRKAIALKRDTVESVDEFVAAVQDRIDGWGTAGDGMYWRPVLQLQVSPDGERRVQDLSRLLKNSGFELQPTNIANQPPQGNSRATR